MTAVGDAGDGNKGSAPPKALLLLPPLMLWGGIMGQLNTKKRRCSTRNKTKAVLIAPLFDKTIKVKSRKH